MFHAGIAFEVVLPELIDGEWISSTRIRQTIDSGELAFANHMLTSPYRISGVVSSGAQRGRTIGFPTANLEEIPSKCQQSVSMQPVSLTYKEATMLILR